MPASEPRRRSLWSPAALGLIALMAVGSVLMWLGLPAGLVFLASRVADSPKPSMGPYLLILIGLPLGMFVIGSLLGALDRAHGRLTGLDDGRPEQAAWLKSMRGDRERRRPAQRPRHRDDPVGRGRPARFRDLVLRLRRKLAARGLNVPTEPSRVVSGLEVRYLC